MQNRISIILLIISAVGILFLFFLSQNLAVKETQINNISNKDLGDKVLIKGKIKEIAYNQNSITILLENQNSSKIEIIMFTNKILNLKQNQTIRIYGKVDSYKSQLQIIVDKITESKNP